MLWLALVFLAVDPLIAATRAKDEAAVDRVEEVYEAIDLATDDPELRIELRRVCKRESWCNRWETVDQHEADAWAGRSMWRRAVAKGWLEPARCEAHKLGDTPGVWAPTGAFGQSPAYGLRFIAEDGECLGPGSLASPYAAARAAVGLVEHLCDRLDACTCADRARWWAGPGVWRRRSPIRNLAALSSQCGPPAPGTYARALVAQPIWWLARAAERGADALVLLFGSWSPASPPEPAKTTASAYLFG